jgi:hypothetical protein
LSDAGPAARALVALEETRLGSRLGTDAAGTGAVCVASVDSGAEIDVSPAPVSLAGFAASGAAAGSGDRVVSGAELEEPLAGLSLSMPHLKEKRET